MSHFLKIDVPDSIKSELETRISKKTSSINYNAFIEGRMETDSSEDFTSEDYLRKIMHSDVRVGMHRNFYRFDKSISDSLIGILQPLFQEEILLTSGHFFYPSGGFMSWHTNSHQAEPHLYVTYADQENQSFFRYLENGVVITDYDQKGITVRKFLLTETPPYFWHCVKSNCNRYSFGFRLVKK